MTNFGDAIIPDEMLDVANNEFFKAASLNGRSSCTDGERLGFALVAVVRWFSGTVLHECNVDFHQAILAAERERFPGSDRDTETTMRRVDFEYGVSFARNYLRRLFTISGAEENDDFSNVYMFGAVLERPATTTDDPSEREKVQGIRETVTCVRAEDYSKLLAAYRRDRGERHV